MKRWTDRLTVEVVGMPSSRLVTFTLFVFVALPFPGISPITFKTFKFIPYSGLLRSKCQDSFGAWPTRTDDPSH